MDTFFVLKWRVDQLLAEVAEAEGLLRHPAVPDGLRRELADAVGRRWQVLRGDLDELSATRALEVPRSSWRRLASIRADAAQTMAETLTVLSGLLLRQLEWGVTTAEAPPLDRHACRLADALLSGVGDLTQGAITWTRATVVGSSISYNPLVHVVQLRFPDFSIWSLPLVLHEAGHYASRELRWSDDGLHDSYPVSELAREIADVPTGTLTHRHVQELFADYLATRVAGPAFPLALVLTQLEPHLAAEPVDSHPAGVRRVAFVLAALGETPAFTGVAEVLGELWTAQLARWQVCPAAMDAELTDLIEALRELVKRYLGDVRYDGWNRAVQHSSTIPSSPVRPLPRPAADLTLRDLLNAAWLWRLEHRDSAGSDHAAVGDRLREQALTLTTAATSSRSPGTGATSR